MVSVSTVNTHASLKHIVKTEREMLQALIDESQKRVNGSVKLEIYKGRFNR